MLNALLDINQIDAGSVRANVVNFPVNNLLERLQREYTFQAEAKGLTLRVSRCRHSIRSDPRLLEQMLRNLIANALKYTQHGKVLLGCRCRRGMLSIQVWDTGIGIPSHEREAIFDEYHQIDNAARERARGLGLGLSIVKRLADMLGHQVHVESRLGKGSVFSIDVALDPLPQAAPVASLPSASPSDAYTDRPRSGAIMIVEDDPDVSDLLGSVLTADGHGVSVATDGMSALNLIAQGTASPDLLLADYNLPNGMNGQQLASVLRKKFGHLPVIILTGDISEKTLHDIAAQDCIQLNKPVKVGELKDAIQRLLAVAASKTTSKIFHPATREIDVFVVDDDAHVREALCKILEDDGRSVQTYESAEAFLASYHPATPACLLIDAYLPGMSGVELLQRLTDAGHRLPAIMITGRSDIHTAVQAMKSGARDFLEKPVGRVDLLRSVSQALEQAKALENLLTRKLAQLAVLRD